MIIQFNESGIKCFTEIQKHYDDSFLASEFYNAYLDDQYDILCKYDFKSMSDKTNKSVGNLFYEALVNDLDVDKDIIKSAEKNNRLNEVHLLSSKEYEKNPYVQKVKPAEKKMGDLTLCWNVFYPYEGFLYKDVKADRSNFYSEVNSLGFFDAKFTYLQLLKDDEIWMSITPYEIETMKEPLNHAKGRVLTFGLGLGYFAFMALLKKEVESVTVVEYSHDVITLFKRNILPLFPKDMEKRLNIIEGNALDVAKSLDETRYDYLFVDLYHSAEDGLPIYCTLLKALPSNLEVDYWIEDSMIVYLRRAMMTLIEEIASGSDASYYDECETLDDHILKSLFSMTSSIELKTGDDVLSLLEKDSLKSLAKSIDFSM